jgi:PAS domain S-box-containing protein
MKGIGFIDRSIVYLPFGFRLMFQVIVTLFVGILEALNFTRTGDTAYFILSLIPIALSSWFARYSVIFLTLIIFASFSFFLEFSVPGARLEVGSVVIRLIYHAVYLLIGVGSCLVVKLYVSLRGEYAIREHTEKEFETERNRLRVTLLSICDGIITTGDDERIIFLNQEGERLTGWSEEEARGRHITEVYTILSERTHEKITNPIQRIVERGYVIGLANHTLLVSKDGKEIPIGDSGAPIRDSDGITNRIPRCFAKQSHTNETQGGSG